MNEVTQLTQSRRKALVDMLDHWSGEVWKRAKKKYEETRKSRKEAIIKEVAGDGITKAKDDILALRDKTRAAEEDLNALGFELDREGSLELVSNRSRIARTVERRLDAEVGTEDEALDRPFADARIKLLLVASAEEAEKIMEAAPQFRSESKIT